MVSILTKNVFVIITQFLSEPFSNFTNCTYFLVYCFLNVLLANENIVLEN